MIIDILVNQQTNALEFTVNTALVEIPVLGPAVGADSMVSISNGLRFQDGDIVFLESIRVVFPYDFGTSIDPIVLGFQWLQGGIFSTPIPEFGTSSSIYYPKPALELKAGFQLTSPQSDLGNFEFQLKNFVAGVSMQNVPAALNGLTLPIDVHATVKHTLPMLP